MTSKVSLRIKKNSPPHTLTPKPPALIALATPSNRAGMACSRVTTRCQTIGSDLSAAQMAPRATNKDDQVPVHRSG